MNHLYQNEEGELVAADTLEDAARHHDCELGGSAEPDDEWSQVPDEKVVAITDGESGERIQKTAREWAAECPSPVLVATTYC